MVQAELNLIESADLQFFRRILNVPKSTPKEMFYLEFGCGKITVYPRKPASSWFHEVRSNNYHNNYCKTLHETVHKLWILFTI